MDGFLSKKAVNVASQLFFLLGKKTIIQAFTKMGCMHAKSLQSCPTLCSPVDCNPSGSSGGILQGFFSMGFSSMGFSRQEYWRGWPFPSPWDLPDPGTEHAPLISPALVGKFFH